MTFVFWKLLYFIKYLNLFTNVFPIWDHRKIYIPLKKLFSFYDLLQLLDVMSYRYVQFLANILLVLAVLARIFATISLLFSTFSF